MLTSQEVWTDFGFAAAKIAPNVRCHLCMIANRETPTTHADGICPEQRGRCFGCMQPKTDTHHGKVCPVRLNINHTCFKCCLPYHVNGSATHSGKTK